MKTRRELSFALGFTVALSALAETNGPATARLKGTVVDPEGRPAENATVECYSNGRMSSLTGGGGTMAPQKVVATNGAFELDLPRQGAVILARKPGLAPVWRQYWNGAPEGELRLVLSRPSILAGKVVDEANNPVSEAEVSVSIAVLEVELEGGVRTAGYLTGEEARDCFKARTSADGLFRIDGFPTNASADLAVRSPGKALRLPVRESIDPSSMLAHAGQEDIRLLVEPAGGVEGKIVADVSGQAFPTARLLLAADGPNFFGSSEQAGAESGADGTFRFPDATPGKYQVRAVFGTNPVPEWVAEMTPVSVEAGQTARGVQVTATRGGLVEVSVLGKKDHEPLAGVAINAYKSAYQGGATSGSNGMALLRLPPGEYQMSAFREGASAESVSVNVEAGKTNTVRVEVPAPSKIVGVVRSPDGQPTPGVAVRIIGGYSDYRQTAPKTDASGRFEIQFDPRRFGRSDMTFCLLARDAERNLAVAQDIDEETGPLDLRLAPGMSVAGRAECEGKPITNVTAALVFWTGRSGMHLPGFAVGTNTPGRFEIPALPPGRKYGLSVSAPGYGQKYVNAVESETEAKRIELDPVELLPANLPLAGRVLDMDDKPVAGASVNLNGEGQPNGNTRTDRDGRFRFEHVCAGSLRLFANSRNLQGNMSAEGGDTNVVITLGQSSVYSPGSKVHRLQGIVMDPENKPVGGAQVAVFPSPSNRIKTGTNGAFSLGWSLQPWQLQSKEKPCLVVRHQDRNLAAAEALSEDTTNLEVRLEPALSVTGRVENPDGTALSDAQVGVWLYAGRTYSEVNEQLARTDSKGNFEIKTLPLGQKYMVYATAKDHGRQQQEIGETFVKDRIELSPFVLQLADKKVAGQVLNEQDKPLSGAYVSISGTDQPQGSATTDSKGRFSFKVCEGTVRLFANDQSGGSGNMSAEAGDTNVIIVIARSDRPGRPSRTGAAAPTRSIRNFAPFGLAAGAAPAGKPLLLCLFDAEQAPSRRLARQVANQRETLRQKGIEVAGIQAAVIPTKTWQTWTNSNRLPFPLGRAVDKSSATKWVTQVASLPWLILRNANGTVAAEGFTWEELERKLMLLKE